MKEIFHWVPWFRELSRKIVEGGEQYLIDKARAVTWRETKPQEKEHEQKQELISGEDHWIDPFSFLYTLAGKNTTNQRRFVYPSVHKEFGLDKGGPDVPDPTDADLYVFPRPTRGSFLFHTGTTEHFDLLWRLFRQTQMEVAKINADDFRDVLGIPRVGVSSLTQALCLANAHTFLPADKFSMALTGVLPTTASISKQQSTLSLSDYVSFMRGASDLFAGCHLYEIGRFLYEHGRDDDGLISDKSRYFQISTKVTGREGVDKWTDFQHENAVWTGGPGSNRDFRIDAPKRGDIMLVRLGTETGKGIGVVLRNDYRDQGGYSPERRLHVLWINREESALSINRLAGLTEAHAKTQWAFSTSYGPSFDLIRHLGGRAPDPDDISNVDESVTQDRDSETRRLHPLNQILYGPPGTGKTWSTVSRAVAIVEGRSVEEVAEEEKQEGRDSIKTKFDAFRRDRQITMTTFHQNYAYEDFVEGIRPVIREDGGGRVAYELRPGVLREMADTASKNLREATVGTGRPDVERLATGFLESLEDRLDAGESVALDVPQGKGPFFFRRVRRSSSGELLGVDLKGPAGGRPRLSLGVLRRDYWAFRDRQIQSPEDIRPVRSGAVQKSGRVLHFALLQRMKDYHKGEWNTEKHEPADAKNFVLIIDEINRGNIARIFGELITLVEESRRIGGSDETRVRLPYSGDEFGVPENLYIIGTMNTADRSIALLDTALRRRFEFEEMMPKSSLVKRVVDGVNIETLLNRMNDRIRFLRDREHQIGHTYFLDVKDIEGLKKAFQNRIVPLLQEYFYDDWARIDEVLGHNGFIETVKRPDGLSDALVDPQQKAYEVLSFVDPEAKKKWDSPVSYQKIYDKKAGGGDKPSETGAKEEAETGRAGGG